MKEIDRIRCLPERDWHEDIGVLTEYLTQRLKTPQGTWTLHQHQAAALADLYDYGGLVLPAPVGSGKTAVSLLGATLVEAKRPLILVPAKLRDKTIREAEEMYAPHWQVPKHFHVQSYEKLSRDWANSYLKELKPDYIFADEAHAFRNTRSACWRKFKAYVKDARKGGHGVFLAFASGTLFNRQLKEFWHLIRAALGPYAPVPKDYPEMVDWSDAMATKLFGPRPDPSFLHCLGRNDPDESDVTRARQAFGDRLARTPGFVFVPSQRPPYSLEVAPYWVDLPGHLDAHFETLRSEWMTPDEHLFDYPMQLWAHARQLACGFYYRPNPRPPQSYINARRDWHGFRSEVLAHSRTYHSPGQLADAIRQGDYKDPGGYLAAWEKAHAAFKLNQEAVWLDDTLLNEAATWLQKERGVCWVEHLAFAERLGELTGLSVYGQGGVNAIGKMVQDERGPIIATLACATGVNMQYNHHKNLIVSCTPTGQLHEQLIGRTHRFGQTEDLVTVDYMLACKEQFNGYWQAVADSRGVADGGFTPDAKLVVATNMVPTTLEGVHAGSAAWR